MLELSSKVGAALSAIGANDIAGSVLTEAAEVRCTFPNLPISILFFGSLRNYCKLRVYRKTPLTNASAFTQLSSIMQAEWKR